MKSDRRSAEPPVPPSNFVGHLSSAVEDVILKALEKDPADRFQSAEEFAYAFQDALKGRPSLSVSIAVASHTLTMDFGTLPWVGKWLKLLTENTEVTKIMIARLLIIILLLFLSIPVIFEANIGNSRYAQSSTMAVNYGNE